jgi:hypothetical protein
LNGRAAQLTRAFFDGSLDVITRHGNGLGVIDRRAQSGVGRGVAAASASRESDLVRALGKDTAFDSIDLRFYVLDLRPFVMTGHEKSFESVVVWVRA